MGYSVIVVEGQITRLTVMDTLKLDPRTDNYERLKVIYAKVSELIGCYRPDCFAIEAPFFGKNVQSMLKLGRAQGVAIAAAMAAGLEICEYSPRKVKQSITGNGNASKEQVWGMLQKMVGIASAEIKYIDASDALAVAVCHSFQRNSVVSLPVKKAKGWKQFIANNAARVKKVS
jgi:crossover junction endodeoxyribonuclease RuvC